MQFSQQSFPRSSSGNGPSGSSASYFSQQSSRGPGGFSQSTFSSSSASYNRQGFGGESRCTHSESQAYARYDNCGGYDSRSAGSSSHGGCNSSDNGFGQSSQWSDTGVSNGKSSINLGDYTLNLNKADSSMLLTNTQTGNQTKIWGDPHIDLNAGTSDQSSGMFNGPLSFELPGHTQISVGTQPGNGNSNVSYADSVTITQGNRAYTVNGLSEQDSAPLTVQRGGNGFALAQQIPQGAMTLIANPSGTGWINSQTHAAVTASDFKA
ncbi:MAG: DUF1521 domain-containing protein [Paraburkholderia sp.]|uniref:DUF1521 domain-containing protein n=1 Tax=Paraburkholderia sp. TaxID=1926495 RepID=UPI003C421FFB